MNPNAGQQPDSFRLLGGLGLVGRSVNMQPSAKLDRSLDFLLTILNYAFSSLGVVMAPGRAWQSTPHRRCWKHGIAGY